MLTSLHTSPSELSKGSTVWYQDPTEKLKWPWVKGKLITEPSASGYSVLLETNQTVTTTWVEPTNPFFQEGANDLMQLTHLNEPSLLHNLHTRFKKDEIYTLAGTVLIAINPFKTLDIYGDAQKAKYEGAAAFAQKSQNTSFGSLGNPTELSPHIYGVAGNAFRQMERDGQSQSIVISGESGSGKTISTQYALKYLASLSSKKKAASHDNSNGQNYEQKLLETNPILEAFGNAKTSRNDNSSRFGKLIQIHFSNQLSIVGASICTYLLEKSRVVHQAKKERGYHVFYQLVAGASDAQRAKFHLPQDPSMFFYLSKSQTKVYGRNDVADFAELCEAFAMIGFSEVEIQGVLQLVAAVLWLGNIEFTEDDNDAAQVLPGDASQNAAELLGVEVDTLLHAMTRKTVGGLGSVTNLKQKAAEDCRDALAKAVYSGLFDWIVDKMNVSLFPEGGMKGTYIGILDIFGFENFDNFVENSFEQLCINYANEKLQQLFCKHEFNLRQQEYRHELGDTFTAVEYQDNSDCIEMLEGAGRARGILRLLDEEAKYPGKRTGAQFVSVLSGEYEKNSLFKIFRQHPEAFQVSHFSDVVKYDGSDMNARNKDEISLDVIKLLASSSNSILQKLGGSMSSEFAARKKITTVGARFRQEMKGLEDALNKTALHFVRCIKPMDNYVPPNVVEFDQKKVMDQIRSAGILTVAQLAKSGFPTRYEIGRFVKMYSSLDLKGSERIKFVVTGMNGWLEVKPPHGVDITTHLTAQTGVHSEITNWLKAQEPTKADCRTLLQLLGIEENEYIIGQTKIFFKTGVLGRFEDKYARLKWSIEVCSKWIRRWQYLRFITMQRRRATAIQCAWRCKNAKRVLEARRIQKAKEEAERKRQEEEAERQRKREAVERERLRVEAEAEARRKEQAEVERKKREKEDEQRRIREEEEERERRRRELEEAERKRREWEEQEADRRRVEELERLRKAEEERERREDEERYRRLEEERQKKLEAERQVKLEEERQRILEEERQRILEEERQNKLEEERRKKLEEERQRILEEERQKMLKEERQKKMEEERQKKMEEERQKKMEEERQRILEEERQKKLEEERRNKLEEERQRALEEERQNKLEEERQARLEEDRQRLKLEAVERDRLRAEKREMQRKQVLMEKEAAEAQGRGNGVTGAQVGSNWKPADKSAIALVSPKHVSSIQQLQLQVSKQRAPSYEYAVEMMNYFLDLAKNLGDDLRVLQDVVSGKAAPPLYDARVEHKKLQKRVVRIEANFVEYNRERAEKLIARTGRGDATQLRELSTRVQTPFRDWIKDVQVEC